MVLQNLCSLLSCTVALAGPRSPLSPHLRECGSKCPPCPPPFCWDGKCFRKELPLAGPAQRLLERKVSFQLELSSTIVLQIILGNDFILFPVPGLVQRLSAELLGMSGIVMNLFPQKWFIRLRITQCNCMPASDYSSKTAQLLPLWRWIKTGLLWKQPLPCQAGLVL